MKEFGLYVLKPNYLTRFTSIDNSLNGLKFGTRPFICVKVSINKQNWVIPIASLNPNKPDYLQKKAKYLDFYKLDKLQAAKDNRPYARAIAFFGDLTGMQTDPNFKSIVEYYNALPVKHKYCKKYRDTSGKHIVITDEQTKNIIKKSLVENIEARIRGEQVGFIKAKIEAGKIGFENYPKKSLQIRRELYKEHLALQKEIKEKRELAEKRRAVAAHKEMLKSVAKGTLPAEKVEIEPMLVYGTYDDKGVLIKKPGNKAGEKTPIKLPAGSFMLDKDGTHVIGVREDLQQKHDLKLPVGQPKRYLK